VLLDLIFVGSVSVSLIHEAGKLANVRSQSETSLFPGHYLFIGFGVSSLRTVHAYHSSSVLNARSVHVRLPLFIQLLKEWNGKGTAVTGNYFSCSVCLGVSIVLVMY